MLNPCTVSTRAHTHIHTTRKDDDQSFSRFPESKTRCPKVGWMAKHTFSSQHQCLKLSRRFQTPVKAGHSWVCQFCGRSTRSVTLSSSFQFRANSPDSPWSSCKKLLPASPDACGSHPSQLRGSCPRLRQRLRPRLSLGTGFGKL